MILVTGGTGFIGRNLVVPVNGRWSSSSLPTSGKSNNSFALVANTRNSYRQFA